MKELPWNDWCEKDWNAWCEKEWEKPNWGKWRSPLFMPKWASRIWLEIVSVRPERLQEITEEDCLKEGLEKRGFDGSALFQIDGFADDICFVGYDLAFKQLWDSLNPKHPWRSNPWVWRIEFKLK